VSEDSESGEKSFEPTQAKLDEARKRGDVPRSAEVNAAASYLGLLLVLVAGGAWTLDRAAAALLIFIDQPDRLMGVVLGPGGIAVSGGIIWEALVAFGPVFVVPIAAVLASLFAQQAIVFSATKIEPKLSKISILSNAKQKFGPTGIVEFLKSTIKLAAISGALFYVLLRDADQMIGAATADPRVLGAMLIEVLVALLTITCIIAITIGGIDLLWQRFDHRRKLRMSFQDMREESKQSEGDPHMKSQRRARGQAIAMNQMLLDVPKADVVIVNPTHYAIALKWSRSKGSAPTCVAKGEDAVALRIREIAATARIPVHSDPTTARALYASVEVGREIAPEHYRAVAAAIRFADRIRKAGKARGPL